MCNTDFFFNNYYYTNRVTCDIFFFRLSGYLGICFSYLGEFQPKIYREKVLSWLEMFWTVGVILLPRMYYIIIIKEHLDDILTRR